ncbi:hypothetical protein [Selenomonas artemidis]|uniref:hypothetical protein n=1 Tax=Selenomonas artemidis TaxID=671224 RepID=UPI0028EA76B5|nr:hypothetical protein [Selenomonas artemidis]
MKNGQRDTLEIIETARRCEDARDARMIRQAAVSYASGFAQGYTQGAASAAKSQAAHAALPAYKKATA